jgi:DNA-binding response OmpR family regulator
MESKLSGKNILILQGSLLAGSELRDAFMRSGARVFVTENLISAFDLIQRKHFDGAIVDQGLHNEAFDLCTEFQALNIPYICCNAPHRLQGLTARGRDADHAVWKLANVMSSVDDLVGDYVPIEGLPREIRTA